MLIKTLPLTESLQKDEIVILQPDREDNTGIGCVVRLLDDAPSAAIEISASLQEGELKFQLPCFVTPTGL